MKTYCVKCRKNTENLNSKIFKTKNRRLIVQSKCPVCGIKKSRFVKEQEANIDKLLPVPTDLSKLSDVVKNDVVKKVVYDKLVSKVNIDTSDFVLKTKYQTDKAELEKNVLI